MSEKVPEGEKPCLKAALAILGYRDNTEKRLREKLEMRGFSEENIDFTIDYLKKNRLFDEKKQFERQVKYLAEQKMYGAARIKAALQKKGFDRAYLEDRALWEEILAEFDFTAACETLLRAALRKKPLPPLPDEGGREERIAALRARRAAEGKLLAAAMRRGYSSSEAREALKRIEGS